MNELAALLTSAFKYSEAVLANCLSCRFSRRILLAFTISSTVAPERIAARTLSLSGTVSLEVITSAAC